MKHTVLLITNFSRASQNAVSYAYKLLDAHQYNFVLVHIYTLPLTYTVEGVALASISESLRDVEAQLNDELDRVRGEHPQINIEGHYVLGGLVESARELIRRFKPSLLVFGTAGYYSALWHTDSELLLALRNLTVPVMIVPEHVSFRAVERIGFACDYKNICVPKQIDFIRTLVHQTQARLYVVHVTRSKPDTELMKRNETVLQQAINDIHPLYFALENPNVFKAIGDFVQTQNLDMLVVIPRKQEFWYSLFHKSNIQQLAFLNRLPILALPE